MGRRILAFFLGMIFGIILLVGGLVGAIYVATCVVPVDKMYAESDNYIGDLAKQSLYDIWQELNRLYSEKAGVADENGNYYTLEQFFAQYNINLNTALGIELPSEVLEIPAFEFFSEGGVDRAMKQIKVSSIPAIVNMFGGKNEDGTTNGMFGSNVIEELGKFSMADLFSEEVGIAGVFANVKLSDVLPSAFPAEDSDNKLMWAVGQATIGGVLKGVSGSENIMLQFKADGAFATLGGMELSSVLGDNQYVNAILGSGAVFADLIADDGSIRLDDIINGVSVGELLGCQKNEITDLTDYVAVGTQDSETKINVMQKGEGETAVYVMSANGEKWYQAELKCEETDEEHYHNDNCFKYVWYSTTECNKQHSHSDDMQKDGVNYPRTDGLYAVLAALSITDLTSGNTDALMNEIKIIKIGDILNGVTVSGVMESFVDMTIEELMNGAIDNMYLGQFFSFERRAVNNINDYDIENKVAVYKQNDTEIIAYYVATDLLGNIAMSVNEKDWYLGSPNCDDDHTHSHGCYLFEWYDENGNSAEGIQRKLSSCQIADLKNLNDEVRKLTLNDVFGKGSVPSMLNSIADVKIGELNNAINTIHLGDLLEYTQTLTCEVEDHEHNDSCYVWKDKNGAEVSGMMAKLAGKQVSDMSNLTDTIKTFTLRDVLGNDIPKMLKSLADTEIGDLSDSINGMFLGDFLEYTHEIVCGHENDENHEHVADCYKWTDKNSAEVNGMMAKLACTKVSELGNLQATIKTFTLNDVLGDDVPNMLRDVANTPVGELSTAIEKMYLGSAMGYFRKEINMSEVTSILIIGGSTSPLPHVRRQTVIVDGVTKPVSPAVYYKTEDGEIWYEAVLNCNIKHSEHNADCYKYVWYTDEDCATKVEGVTKAFVNNKLNNVAASMDTLTLKELGISSEGNNILKAIENVPIMDIGSHINNLMMGDVLGYTGVCNNTEEHVHDENCKYTWYEDANKTTVVKGLNAKIANMTIGGMNGGTGLTEIAQSLTIGDLIDSGMMTVGTTENEYKLAIIYCGDNSHSFIESTTLFGSKTWKCNLSDYLSYSVANGASGVSAETYWKKCHGINENAELTEQQLEHKNKWMELELGEFMSTLLNSIK